MVVTSPFGFIFPLPLQVLLLMQVPPASEDDRLAKAALYTKFTGGLTQAPRTGLGGVAWLLR